MHQSELDARYGVAKEPLKSAGGIHDWEKSATNKIKKPKSLVLLSRCHIHKLIQLDTVSTQNSMITSLDEVIILWLVDRWGRIWLAYEELTEGGKIRAKKEPGKTDPEIKKSQALGHPTLVDGEAARIGGELWFEDGEWYLSNKSGRYGFDREGIADILANVAADFADAGLSVEIKVY